MKDIKLELSDGEIIITSPYNETFVNRAHNLRGKFKDGKWHFDDEIIDYVRELMLDCYGTTGETPYDNVTLLIKDKTLSSLQKPVFLFGRLIARAFGRDSNAKLGDGIVLLKGSCSGGGSVKNWYTCINNATFQIRDFPEPGVNLPEVSKAINEGWCEVIRTKNRTRKEMIDDCEIPYCELQIKRYQQKINELNKELDSYK